MKRLIATLCGGFFLLIPLAVVFSLEATELTAAQGAKIETGGWADKGNMLYSKGRLTIIDDERYADPVEKRHAFTRAIASGNKFIVLSGTVDLSDGKISDTDHQYFDAFSESGGRLHADITFPVSSNVTILGVNDAKIAFGGLTLRDVRNIVIRNVTFWDAHGSTEVDTRKKENSKASIDNISVHVGCSNIWIDHCTFTDGTCVDLNRNYHHDGAVDFREGKNITVSYCAFTNHDKVMLVRPGDSFTDAGGAQITLHHNYFYGTVQRMPRTRGCMMHIYNNVYDRIGTAQNTGSSLGPGIGSLYIVENNFFGKHAGTIVKYFDSSANEKAATFSRFYQRGNIPDLANERVAYDKVDKTQNFKAHIVVDKPFAIPYAYQLELAADIQHSVPAQAGAGKPIKIEGYN